ncbi:hypothetical protein P691DRAFT_161996 [Macrolepiota fuliginosa MF-IS2]|uniref:Uncharacterized protein n=1 Tax=Macrolepiota fuliginosa MF-IS2 TaxID=1400762 RepID=A0A9P6C5Q0_9AGAR|nr:hypothetical protein P691DRAFT_161996 [Macrolepiota fuliginosa MF-IS2]
MASRTIATTAAPPPVQHPPTSAPAPPHPVPNPPHTFPIPNIYATSVSGRGRAPTGGMRRSRPGFSLQDISTAVPPATPDAPVAPPSNVHTPDENTNTPDSATASPNTATQSQNPAFLNRARLGAGRPLPNDSPQAGPSQPLRRPTDFGSPFANFSRIVYVSFSSTLVTLFPASVLIDVP